MGELSSDIRDNVSLLDGTTGYVPPPPAPTFTPNRPSGGSRSRTRRRTSPPPIQTPTDANFSRLDGTSSREAPPPPTKKAAPPSLRPDIIPNAQLASIRQRLAEQEQSRRTGRAQFTPSSPVASSETDRDRGTKHKIRFGLPQPQGTVEKTEPFVSTATKIEQKLQLTSNPGEKIALGGGLILYGAGEFAVNVFKDFSAIDFETGKPRVPLTGTVKSLLDPIGTGAHFAQFAATHPERAAGQLLAIGGTGRGIGKLKGKPKFEVTKGTGAIEVLETPGKTQILIEATTKPFKGKGTPPQPRPFYAELKGISIETDVGVMNKFLVKDIAKINPITGAIEIVKRTAEQQGATIKAFQKPFIPDTTLGRTGRVIETPTIVTAYDRVIIKEGPVDIFEYPKPGEGLFKVVTEPGLKIYSEQVKGSTRIQKTFVEQTEILGEGKPGTFSYRTGEIVSKPKIPKSPLTTKTKGAPVDTVAIVGANPGEVFIIQKVLKPFKPLLSVIEKPISSSLRVVEGAAQVITAARAGSKKTTPSKPAVEQPSPTAFTPTKNIPVITADFLVKDFSAATSQPLTKTVDRQISIGNLPPPISKTRTAETIITPIADTKIKPPNVTIKTRSRTRSRSKTTVAQIFEPAVVHQPPINILDQKQEQSPELAPPILDLIQTQTGKSRYALRTPTLRTVRPIAPIKSSSFSQEIKRQGTGYDVLVRRSGIFSRVSRTPFTKQGAINYGAFVVGTSAAASFKIQESKTRGFGKSFRGSGNLSDFYKKGNIFIEKREKRITTSGEKKEITYKGLLIKKLKAKKLWM